jgi:methionyl-tRNA formyltransferase
MSLNLVFAGTPDFASHILQSLLEEGQHNIQAVLTQPDRPAGRGRHLQMSPVKQLAQHHEIPVFQPLSLKKSDEQTQTLQKLHELKPDLMIVVAYGLILPQNVLDIPKQGCWNVHASLLPHWRGASPIQQVILQGDSLTGITIMQMDAGLDTGDIISLHPCTIELSETSESLQKRLANIAGPALLADLKTLETAGIVKQKQDSSKASYAPKISKTMAKINWKQSAVEIERQIRAFNPWPIAFFELDNQAVRIFSAALLPNIAASNAPGTVVNVSPEGIDIATGEGGLRLTELQFPGGKRQNVASILNSKHSLFKPGRQLPNVG